MPHHNFRQWLLNQDEDGFTQLTLSPNNVQTLTWETPLSAVRASSGNSQWENFWPVFALMDGPHDTYNSVITEPVLAFQTIHLPSKSPVTAIMPSADNAQAVTAISCA